MKTKKSNKGITLIALVITIIVLLILAGVSLSLITGSDGILGRSEKAVDQTNISSGKEQAELLVADYLSEYYEEGYVNAKQDVATQTAEEYIQSKITETGMVTSAGDYFVTISSDNKITVYKGISVDENNKTAEGTLLSGGKVVWDEKMTLKPTDTTPVEDPTIVSFSTNYGTIDVIWLSGTSNTPTTTPNAPVLTSNEESMTPVIWNESNNIVTTSASDTNWYSYNAETGRNEDGSPIDNTSSKWANAKTANDSYFVWIPRYAYRITYYESQTSTTPTGYYDGFGMWNATDGTVKYALESGVETITYNGMKYIVHPAFETDLDLGGWSNDLSGFWFAKFEMSGTGTTLVSTYGTASIREQFLGKKYTSARQATYGYTGTADTDGNTSFMNSHMMKNSEWGAVAYLTQSQYGRNGNEVTINSDTSFNRGGGSGTAYLTNTEQSTTGNVYGIYDMVGGAYEYVASFDKLGSSMCLSGSGYAGDMTKNAKDSDGNYISTKYITAYSHGTSTRSGTMIYTIGKTGDATKEVYIGSGMIGWFSDYSLFVNSSHPFSVRGGRYNTGKNTGVFSGSDDDGYGCRVHSFRTALCQ